MSEFTQKKKKNGQKNNENNEQQPLRQQQHAVANCTEIARNKQPATADR